MSFLLFKICFLDSSTSLFFETDAQASFSSFPLPVFLSPSLPDVPVSSYFFNLMTQFRYHPWWYLFLLRHPRYKTHQQLLPFLPRCYLLFSHIKMLLPILRSHWPVSEIYAGGTPYLSLLKGLSPFSEFLGHTSLLEFLPLFWLFHCQSLLLMPKRWHSSEFCLDCLSCVIMPHTLPSLFVFLSHRSASPARHHSWMPDACIIPLPTE
jgi:hypothetical protein